MSQKTLPKMDNGWHWCEFCQEQHSAITCFAPGSFRYYEMKANKDEEIDTLHRQLDDALGLLKRVEWSRQYSGAERNYCLFCEGTDGIHSSNCDLFNLFYRYLSKDKE